MRTSAYIFGNVADQKVSKERLLRRKKRRMIGITFILCFVSIVSIGYVQILYVMQSDTPSQSIGLDKDFLKVKNLFEDHPEHLETAGVKIHVEEDDEKDDGHEEEDGNVENEEEIDTEAESADEEQRIHGEEESTTNTNDMKDSQQSMESENKEKDILRYYQLPDPKIQEDPKTRQNLLPMRSSSSYAQVHRYEDADIPPNLKSHMQVKKCLDTCCYEKVAISIDHEMHRIKSTIDGLDVAELLLHGHAVPDHLQFPNGVDFDQEIVPCVQPGTIVHADSYGPQLDQMFLQLRPNMTTPYVFIASETDGPQPDRIHRPRIESDYLLLHWYGNNPLFDKPATEIEKKKFTGFPLGLSKYHPQMPYLDYYLSQTNYTNPFAQAFKHRWIDSSTLFHGKNDSDTLQNVMFTKFGLHNNAKHRWEPYRMACGNHVLEANGTDPEINKRVSCSLTGDMVPKHLQRNFGMYDTYSAASQYLFGLSPPGNGKDCYRTYELWLLGVIPIIKDTGFTNAKGANMFQDLPVIELQHFRYSQEDLVKILQDYIQSDAFIKTDFSKGWERLFLGYWRHKIASDAGRQHDLVQDENGKNYFMAWKYSKMSPSSKQ